MPIVVFRVADLYEAEVTPPHGRGQSWRSPCPQTIDALIASLEDLGCHQTDIGDALYLADPDWLSHGDRNASQSVGDARER
jgi:hypothetical protein